MATFDLNSLVTAQRSYITDLGSGVYGNANASGALSQASLNLNSIYSNLSSAAGSISATLDNQQDMLNIVNNEKLRLVQKKQSVDTALDGQKRIIGLNDSYRQRSAQYINIIIVIIVTLVLIFLLSLLSKLFPFVPSFIFDILVGLVILAGIYFVYLFYSTIQSRAMIDFNRLNLAPPKILTPAEAAAAKNKASSLGDLFGSIDTRFTCIGADCCTDGTYYDTGNAVCLPGNPPTYSGFTTMSMTGKTTLPNSAHEFGKYARYN